MAALSAKKALTVLMIDRDERFMVLALEEARAAALRGDVPIAALVVRDGEVVSAGSNRKERDPTAHAEIIALRRAAEAAESWNLRGCTLYVTVEPCPMCAGALVLARVDRLVYGCADPRAGGVRHPVRHRQGFEAQSPVRCTERGSREGVRPAPHRLFS